MAVGSSPTRPSFPYIYSKLTFTIPKDTIIYLTFIYKALKIAYIYICCEYTSVINVWPFIIYYIIINCPPRVFFKKIFPINVNSLMASKKIDDIIFIINVFHNYTPDVIW